jgi:hypothetical protein
MGRQGRPCRADVPATCFVKVWLTPAEKSTVRALARSYDTSLSDVLRLGVLTLAAEIAEGDVEPPMAISGLLVHASDAP